MDNRFLVGARTRPNLLRVGRHLLQSRHQPQRLLSRFPRLGPSSVRGVTRKETSPPPELACSHTVNVTVPYARLGGVVTLAAILVIVAAVVLLWC